MRIRLIGTILFLLPVLGCGSDSANGPSADDLFEAALTLNGVPGTGVSTLDFPLTGTQLVPPRATDASGSVNMKLGKSQISYTITLANASGVTRAELYLGSPKENGTLAAVLFSGTPIPFINTVLVDSAIAASDILDNTISNVFDAVANGQAYVVISAADAPQGLLRGQTAPSGIANLTIGSGAVAYAIRTYQLEGITTATLNEGIPGRSGDVKIILFEDDSGRNGIDGQLASGVFHASDIVDSTSMGDLIELIRNGGTYINVTTTDEPAAAIRGQVVQPQ